MNDDIRSISERIDGIEERSRIIRNVVTTVGRKRDKESEPLHISSITCQCDCITMETRTVKPPKALPNTFRKVMPTLVVANKHSQGKKDLGDPRIIRFHITHSLLIDCSIRRALA